MKSNLVFVVVFIVFGKTRANDDNVFIIEDCSEASIADRTLTCFQNSMTNFDTGREEDCKELHTLENCLASILDECVVEVEHRQAVDFEFLKIKAKIGNVCSNKALGKTQQSMQCSLESVKWRSSNCYIGILRLIGMDWDTSHAQVCIEFKNAENCLRSLAHECLPARHIAHLEKKLKILNARLNLHCGVTDDGEDDGDACMEANKVYIYDCLRENQRRAITYFFGRSNPNPNYMKCTLYNWITECVTERVEVKCGAAASHKMRQDLNEPPEEIKIACDAANMKYRN